MYIRRGGWSKKTHEKIRAGTRIHMRFGPWSPRVAFFLWSPACENPVGPWLRKAASAPILCPLLR